MRPYNLTIPAGGYAEVHANGDFVRINTAAITVTVETMDGSSKLTMREGQSASVAPFLGVRVHNQTGTDADVTILLGLGDFRDSSISGDVTATIVQAAAITPSSVAVSDVEAAATAADADRKLIHFRNTGAADVALVPSGTAFADAAIILAPGDELREEAGAGAAWYAICDAAQVSTLAVYEGA